MIEHLQASDNSRLYYNAAIVDNGNGTLSIPATTFWLLGAPFQLQAYTPTIGSGPFRLWIEADGGSVDYFLDLTLEGPPQSLGPGVGSHIVAWRDSSADQIHVLRSVPHA